MRVTVTTYGSEGDVRPLAALCVALVRAGHQVTFVADGFFAPLVEGTGVTLVPLSGSLREILNTEEVRGVFERGANPRLLTQALVKGTRDHIEDWTRTLHEACRDSHVLVSTGLTFYIGAAVAEKLDIPMVGVGLQPIGPTREFPPPLMPPPKRPLPGWLNKLLHIAIMEGMWAAFRGPVNKARRNVLGLPRRWRSMGELILKRRWHIIYAYSPALLPKAADWPELLDVVGYWLLDTPDWTPPDDLAHFLADGPPPVYIGFGSMGGFDPKEATRMAVDALDGRRAVLAAGWGGFSTEGLPDTVFGLDHAPHDWLLPRMQAIVHHGGAGTTGAALRAGKPSVVVPHLGDQPFWGWCLQRAGVAPAPIPRPELTAQRLRAALDAIDQPMIERAAALGEIVRGEDGLNKAVAIIERAAAGQ